MTPPDPEVLAAAIKLAEEGLQVFRGIDDPEIKKEVVLNEAILAAAKAYQPMREALESVRQYGADTLSGRADGGPDDRKWQRDAVREMTRRAGAFGFAARPVPPKMTAADLGCREQTCQQGLGDPPMDCGWPECGCGLRLLDPPPAAFNPAGPA